MSREVQDLIILRDKKRHETKDYSRAKKKRLVASAVMQSLVAVPYDIKDELIKVWRDLPDLMTVEEIIICQRALNAMSNGKDAIKDAQFLMNTAYGTDSVDSQVNDVMVMPNEMPAELIRTINDALESEF